MSSQTSVPEKGRNRFVVHLGILHPTVTPDELSAVLELDGVSMRPVDEPPTTAVGVPLAGGHADTYWRYSERHTVPDEYFAEQLADFVERLKQRRGSLAMLRESGGVTGLTIQFPGDGYFGDCISLETLTAIVELGLEFNIECHPFERT